MTHAQAQPHAHLVPLAIISQEVYALIPAQLELSKMKPLLENAQVKKISLFTLIFILACSSHCDTCSSTSACSYCSSGYYLSGNQCVQVCPAGTYADDTNRRCAGKTFQSVCFLKVYFETVQLVVQLAQVAMYAPRVHKIIFFLVLLVRQAAQQEHLRIRATGHVEVNILTNRVSISD